MTLYPTGIHDLIFSAFHEDFDVLWCCENSANHVIAVCVDDSLHRYLCVILNGTPGHVGEIIQSSVCFNKKLAKDWFITTVIETCQKSEESK